MDVIKSFLGV